VRRSYRLARRGADLVFGVVGLIVSSPIIALSALWVKLDSPGPAFYSQTRLGRGGQEFKLVKLRTMRQDAENSTGPVWARVGDRRLTGAGRILRQLYLDELPQFLNVALGQMSLIGPRPERPFFYPECERRVPGFSQRLAVKPGLTGLAQARQRHHDSTGALRRKYRYDMFYIRRQGLAMDLFVIRQTFGLLWSEVKEVLR
jgi:lipopolysaccharide/colanic/teichoic acid biosynthesis glycosyltransferase